MRDKKGRDRTGQFVIDDLRDLHRAIACDYVIDELFYCAELDQSANSALTDLPCDIIYDVSSELMEKISYRRNPAPVVAVMQQKSPLTYHDIDPDNAKHILGLVDLRKPGNIGALLRTADATGFKHIFMIDTALDLYNPNIIRSSTGASFLNNIYTLTSEEALDFFAQNHYTIISAIVEADTPLPEVKFTQRNAIILGTEDVGLNDTWVAHCDIPVRVPMVGTLSDSLNVSVSGAIFMYEALRQSRW